MRDPEPFSNWLKLTSLLFVAPTNFTGTCTSPKLMDPVQMELGIGSQVTYGRRPVAPREREPGNPEEGHGRGRRTGAGAHQPRQAAVPGSRLRQGRRDRLLPPDRAGHAPPSRRAAADSRARAQWCTG